MYFVIDEHILFRFLNNVVFVVGWYQLRQHLFLVLMITSLSTDENGVLRFTAENKGRKMIEMGSEEQILQIRRILFFLTFMIPIYFIILLNTAPVQLVFLPDPILNRIIWWVGVPLLFSSPWFFIIFTLREEIVMSVSIMSRETTLLPLKWRLFYGFNAAMLLGLLVLPFFSPLLLVVAAVLGIGRLVGKINPHGASTLRLGCMFVVLGVLIVIPIGWFVVVFFSQYIAFFMWLIQLWFAQVDNVYTVSTLIIDTLTFGSFFWVLAEQIYEEQMAFSSLPFAPLPTRRIQIIEFVIFSFLFIMWMPPLGNQPWVVDLASQISLVVVVLVYLYRKIARLPKNKTHPGLIGVVWVVLFLVIYLVDSLSPIRPLVVILAGSAMCVVFLKSILSSILSRS